MSKIIVDIVYVDNLTDQILAEVVSKIVPEIGDHVTFKDGTDYIVAKKVWFVENLTGPQLKICCV